MDFLQAIIFGVVQGISEFLPISSTGHLILTGRLLNLTQTDFLKSFDIIIQLGSILAVMVLYWRQLFTDWETIKKIIVAFVPTGILGLIFYKIVKTYLLGNNTVVLWALFLGGIALIAFEIWYKIKSLPTSPLQREENKGFSTLQGGNERDFVENISYKNCLYVGLFQSVAMIPGVSRSAATILGGLMLGIKRKTIVEFSFLLAVPTMLAATGLDLIKNAGQFSLSQWDFLTVGFIVSFIVALASIKFLLNFIKKHTFISFGIYRIAVAVAFWLLI